MPSEETTASDQITFLKDACLTREADTFFALFKIARDSNGTSLPVGTTKCMLADLILL